MAPRRPLRLYRPGKGLFFLRFPAAVDTRGRGRHLKGMPKSPGVEK